MKDKEDKCLQLAVLNDEIQKIVEQINEIENNNNKNIEQCEKEENIILEQRCKLEIIISDRLSLHTESVKKMEALATIQSVLNALRSQSNDLMHNDLQAKEQMVGYWEYYDVFGFILLNTQYTIRNNK
jgi:hypothetical protein